MRLYSLLFVAMITPITTKQPGICLNSRHGNPFFSALKRRAGISEFQSPAGSVWTPLSMERQRPASPSPKQGLIAVFEFQRSCLPCRRRIWLLECQLGACFSFLCGRVGMTNDQLLNLAGFGKRILRCYMLLMPCRSGTCASIATLS